eukprot:3143137-Rhodomonas_salina.3
MRAAPLARVVSCAHVSCVRDRGGQVRAVGRKALLAALALGPQVRHPAHAHAELLGRLAPLQEGRQQLVRALTPHPSLFASLFVLRACAHSSLSSPLFAALSARAPAPAEHSRTRKARALVQRGRVEPHVPGAPLGEGHAQQRCRR